MMLTPETGDGNARSRLRLEITPDAHAPCSPRGSHRTPGKSDQFTSLHFNSQQYRTPSSHPHRAHLRQHVSSPQCATPPGPARPGPASSGSAFRGTPRALPRFPHLNKTPSSSGSTGSRLAALSATPRSLKMTPNGILYNPFETDPEKMKGWILSPGIFATKSKTGDQENSPFWSIDHIAMMQPAEIDETGLHTAKLHSLADPENEERAQRAIDQFFASNAMILPSPWSDDSSQRRTFQFSQSPVTPGVMQMTGNAVDSPIPLTLSNDKTKDGSGTEDNVGNYYTQEGREDGTPDALSTSSLRRKLFFHGEESNPPSPVQDTQSHDPGLPMEDEVPSTGELCLTPQSSKRSSHNTPGSNMFSSSPIHSDSDRGSQTPSLRRCSTAPELMASPSLSPISSQKNPARRSLSKEGMLLSETTPLCQPLHNTPSSGRPSLPFNSPGVSPIRLEASRCSAMDEGSSDHTGSSGSIPSNKHPAAFSMGPLIRPTPDEHTSQGCHSRDMDVDRDFSFTRDVDAGDAFGSSSGFRVIRGFTAFSDSTIDQSAVDDQTGHPAHSTHVAQDTGYQTNSLQSLHHTNLTYQFGSLLPTSRDTGLEEDYNTSSMDYHLPDDPSTLFSSTRLPPPTHPDDEITRGPDFKLPSQKLNPRLVPSCTQSDSSNSRQTLDESLVLRQARKALGKPELSFSGNAGEDGTEGARMGSGPEGECPGVFATEIQSHWSVTVPTPLRRKLHQVGLIDSSSAVGEKQVMPSSIALKAIQKAGRDYDVYCKPQLTKTNYPKPSIVRKEILTADFEEDDFLELDGGIQFQSS